MKNPYNMLVASTIFTMKHSQISFAWKFMTLFCVSVGFVLYAQSIWLILDYYFKGFTDFLTIDAISNSKYSTHYYSFIYFTSPSLIINSFLIFPIKKHEEVIAKYPQTQNKKYFFTFFFSSYIVTYICLMIVI